MTRARPGRLDRGEAGGPPADGRALARHLAAGGRLAPLAAHTLDGLSLQVGEHAYADVPAHAAWYTSADGPPVRSAALLVLGPPRWMIAALLLNAVLERRARRRAAAEQGPAWRDGGSVRLVLTDARTLIGSATGWQQLRHPDIAHTQPDPRHGAVVLVPGDGAAPLRLAGPWIGAYTCALTWLLGQPSPPPQPDPGPGPGQEVKPTGS